MAKNPMQAVRHKNPQKKTAQKRPIRKKKAKKKNSWAIWAFVFGFGLLALYFLIRPVSKGIYRDYFKQEVPVGFPSLGLDISHHQGKIDWELLFNKEQYDTLIHFVYCKSTEGSTHVDREWSNNRKYLNDLGLPNGAYHFFSPTEDPEAQAKHFLSHWKKRDIDLPPVLDVELEAKNDSTLIQHMNIWLHLVESRTGMRPIIYTPLNFYEKKFQQHFLDYRFWLAAYSRKPDCIADKRVIHWQFSDKGEIPGTKEKVDLSVSKVRF